MKTVKADVAVIGAGTAGLAAYRAAKTHAKRVIMIERGPYGTTCARVGCMPSKLLISAADAAHGIAAAPGFGVYAGPLRIDGKAVMARVRAERDRFVGFVVDGVKKIPAADRLRGDASFVDDRHLRVDQHTLVEADRFVIATGSSAVVPLPLQGAGARVVISDDVFSWDDLPSSLAVIGTGIIGLELGQALHRLGVRVTLFGRSDKLAQLTDPAVRAVAARHFAGEFDLRLNNRILDAQAVADGVLLRFAGVDGQEQTEHYSCVLAATGRAPNVSGLGLENARLALKPDGVPEFDPHTMQCGSSHIFIAGDAGNELPLLHEAADQGRIAGDNAGRYPEVRAGLRRTPLAIVFSDPQIATLGQTYRTLQSANPNRFAIGQVSFEDQGRSRVMLQNHGLLRVYAEYGSGRLLGAEMIGPRAEHLAHLLAWSCQNKMSVRQMLEMPIYHPVVEEGLRTALRDADEKLRHGVPDIEHCADCTPGM